MYTGVHLNVARRVIPLKTLIHFTQSFNLKSSLQSQVPTVLII